MPRGCFEGWVATPGLTARGLRTVAEPRYCVRARRRPTGHQPPCLKLWACGSCRSGGDSLEVGTERGGSLGRGSRGGAGLRLLLPVLCSVSRLPLPSLLLCNAPPQSPIRWLHFSGPPHPLGTSPSCAVQVMRTVGDITLLGQFSWLLNTASQKAGLT